jgi:hypothetical protein
MKRILLSLACLLLLATIAKAQDKVCVNGVCYPIGKVGGVESVGSPSVQGGNLSPSNPRFPLLHKLLHPFKVVHERRVERGVAFFNF